MPTQPPRYVRISRKAQRSQPEPLPLPAHLGERPAATPQPPSPRGQRQRQGQAQTAAGKREPTVLRTPQPNGAGPGGSGTPAAGGAEQHGSHGPSRSSRQRGARGTERNGAVHQRSLRRRRAAPTFGSAAGRARPALAHRCDGARGCRCGYHHGNVWARAGCGAGKGKAA